VARYLVLGDPVVALGPAALIPDGALIVEGAEITAVGSREVLAARGPFDRVLGSAGHFVMPGFVNCHYHSELAIGPGLYQHIFEKANVYIQGGVGPVDEEDLYDGILWGLVTAIKGGQTGTVDMYYGRTGMEHFGCEPALLAYRDAGLRTAFGLVSRDQNIYAHQADETFLARLPAALADEVRRSPMGYAWPVDDVMATFETLSRRWHGQGDRIRIVTAPDWTPACSDELYQRCAQAAGAHGTSLVTHALETRAEMMFSLERYGKPAVRRLADLGVLGPRTVLGHGQVLMEAGRVTIVDEDRVRDRFAAAVRERIYQPSPQVRRWAELGSLVEPYLAPLYQPWYDVPVEPAHAYNARHVPGGKPEADRRAD
jgi:5-methylthioadenosine/S-adenosylhomocysteine deaminase